MPRTRGAQVNQMTKRLDVEVSLTEAPAWAEIELQDYQRPPAGDWRTWAFKGARDTGKTLAAAVEVIEDLREHGRAARWVVGAPTKDDVILTCAEGPTGLITLFRNEFSRYRLTSSGAEAWHYLGGYVRFLGCEKPARWHGGNWSGRWLDEVPFCNRRSIEEGDFALRLGERPREIWTMTPFGISRWLKGRLEGLDVAVTRASIYDNRHASPRAIADFEARYKGTTLGKAFLEGLDVDMPEGACWPELTERREHFLRPMPAGLRAVRNGAGVDWGTTQQHLASVVSGSVMEDGTTWIRRGWHSAAGSSKLLIDALKAHRTAIGVSFAAIDRSQWSLADWVDEAGIAAIKGSRAVDWRVSLVKSALEQGRLFFDSEGDGVTELYEFLTQYHRDDESKIVEEEDDDADALCYLFAEFESPGIEFGSHEDKTVSAKPEPYDPYQWTELPKTRPSERRIPEGAIWGTSVRGSEVLRR